MKRPYVLLWAAAMAALIVSATIPGWARAQEPQTQKRITIRLAEVTIARAFELIETQAGVSIAWETGKLDTSCRIALSLDGVTLAEAMTEVLRQSGSGMSFKTSGHHVILIEKTTPSPTQAPKETIQRGAKKSMTVSGRVTDSTTGEVIIGCVIMAAGGRGDLTRSTTTNAYGFYSLTLTGVGQANIRASMPGYATDESSVMLTGDVTLNFSLSAATTSIEAVTVRGGLEPDLLGSQPGAQSIPIARIKSAPALLGESDLMKSLQYIAGVQGGTEGKADLSVRGGSPDQNLILLDGNPIYNANHLFGFVSVFNTDALKNVTLYKSGFPARFGGRLSSVIDINTKDGDKQHFGGSATMGLLAAKFNIEGPIVKDRTSFTLSGRRSWADLFLPLFQEDDYKLNIFFYDLNAKIHHRISDRTSFYLSAYNGRDRLGAAYNTDYSLSKQSWKWENTVVSGRLNSALTPSLFLNANLSWNRYGYNTAVSETYRQGDMKGSSIGVDYSSGITDFTATMEAEYTPAAAHFIRAGVQGVYHDFRPEALAVKESAAGARRNVAGGRIPATEASVYIEDEWRLGERLALNGGVRATLFRVNGRTYTGFDPRLSARLRLSDRVSLKAAYTRMQQYIHLLSNNSLIFQADLWVPSTDRVPPMNSTQYAAGLHASLPKGFNLSVEGYYKDMTGVIEYRDGVSFAGSSAGWEDKVEGGVGRAYGAEISIERKVGSTTGSVAYAWSRSERRFEGIDQGRWFPAKYDRRHAINITVTQRLSKKVDITASWHYTSGYRMTIPMMGTAGYNGYVPGDSTPHQSWADELLLDGRNNYRTPAYHRLDVGINFHPRKWRSPERYGEWSFSVYNAYNRMNAFAMYVDTGSPWDNYRPKLKKTVIFPILPSVSYTYNF